MATEEDQTMHYARPKFMSGSGDGFDASRKIVPVSPDATAGSSVVLRTSTGVRISTLTEDQTGASNGSSSDLRADDGSGHRAGISYFAEKELSGASAENSVKPCDGFGCMEKEMVESDSVCPRKLEIRVKEEPDLHVENRVSAQEEEMVADSVSKSADDTLSRLSGNGCCNVKVKEETDSGTRSEEETVQDKAAFGPLDEPGKKEEITKVQDEQPKFNDGGKTSSLEEIKMEKEIEAFFDGVGARLSARREEDLHAKRSAPTDANIHATRPNPPVAPKVKPENLNSRVKEEKRYVHAPKPVYVKKEVIEEKMVVEDGDFPVEKEWYLVGRSLVTAISTSKGRKLVDNEIVYFKFPTVTTNWKCANIVRFSTKRNGEIGRLPMELSNWATYLARSGKVKMLGRCVAAPANLQMMQDITLYVSFYIHSMIFTDVNKSTWCIGSPPNIDSMIYPLRLLFKHLKIKPYQQAEFTVQELNSNKRLLNLEDDSDKEAAMLPVLKRRRGCEQNNEDNQDVSETSLNKIVGAADSYNLEEMEPPSTLMCNLRPYQKQALYWMSESEEGIDVEKAAETLHPCWEAYRICDGRAPSIYVNVFNGEATIQFPAATQMARGGILADAMGLGKTVMTIALILARPGRGSPDNENANVTGNMSQRARQSSQKAKGGTLIVCPMALLSQWKDEMETHSSPDSLSVLVCYGGDKTNNPRVIADHDVVLTTYGVLSSAYKQDMEKSIFHRVNWYRVVLDEAHTIKSWKTQVAKAAFELSSHCRWCLTGTPLQNKLEDLYSLLCFLHVEPWCNWAWWNKFIQKTYENGNPQGLKLIKAILRPLMLRRTKETRDNEGRLILELPPTDVQVVECEQSEEERDFYTALFKRSKVQFDQFVAQGKVLHNYANILELLLRLRQCCNHPFLVMSRADSQRYADLDRLAKRFLDNNMDSMSQKPAPSRAYVEEVIEDIRKGESKECPICLESADDPVLTPCAHRMCRECLLSSWRAPTCGLCPICRTTVSKNELISCPTESKFRVDVVKNWKESSKVSKLLWFLERIQRCEKSIVFSQWTSFFDLLEIPLRRRGIGFLRFDGKLAQKAREKILKEFNESSEKRVLLMSLKAGGVGLNLTVASNVFLMDPWWNPAVEEQAIMRVHRIGQKRTVRVRRFIVKDTVEERMQQVQARKQRMIAGALTDEEVRSARLEELKMLFR
ncbi:PREDICTED: putative SWI/SNF-related matrix-associated actin-dependent regulator of chromatin subfamily A member 3-like 3 [Tarenaya hassleriana]|uniref:putative SWI/SNF-related matrix-associated actin-dependent regulator of chromatin subfamily A member 3-like 3 n=1 Tax=Tarenaya hassleriana TaxID=28532 RepID=UPI00053CA9CE|nr:PREDICTED: putative SWI/SNF-related matrix-associated actin-dependent regulator of chromatin subfamily A member 3-like 3 [Tarenaya hassleriana]